MSKKRDAYVHTRVTQREMLMIDALALHLRRTRSDTLRFLALEKAEELGLCLRHVRRSRNQPRRTRRR